MSALISTYPYKSQQFISAKGSTLIDQYGKKYLDFYAGISCTNLGHLHPAPLKALQDQAQNIWYHSNYFCHPKTLKLAEKITGFLPYPAQVFFGNSGAEANEGALKLARRWSKKNKSPRATNIIAFEKSFHGRTMATLACTGKEQMREDFAPLIEGVSFAKINDIKSVQEKISPETSCIILELIQGEGGVNIAEKKFVQDLRKICDAEKIILIIDEIQTGIGRTGTMFSFEYYGIEPDIFTTAKALGNGFPIGAFVAKKNIAESFSIGDHGTTFGGNPLSSAVALATLEEYTPAFLQEVQEKEKFLKSGLDDLQEKFPEKIFAVRGKGLMWGVEFFSSEDTLQVYTKMLEQEKIVTLTAGDNFVWRLLPPLIITKKEMENFLVSAERVIADLCIQK